ncbi:endonuclease/exonuclease/phosphatase [Photobacterium phosphoreum]|uniref:endonuclease/exonuclease/phosphatase family protein n=1 Tax=Photobacterium phosphoreum TaxID=659 RepID=UPI000D17C9B8|nr:endonuclease/exonuclease/phosphatase [Photobacterium phosphoreum]PSU61236.1 endonuclease/exonuclease/phosphatase [Photobacterium phosphoreum]PSW27492.1 endonuclease/exonuclease/phosphatase [Photobacterium phosphoreum]
MFLHSLKMAWWNVSMSPASNKAASKGNTNTHKQLFDNLMFLFSKYDMAVIALCEVSSTDIVALDTHFQKSPFQVLDLTFKAGKTRFDTAIIYNKDLVFIEHQYDLKNEIRSQTIKAGQKILLTEKMNMDEFTLILCHWASKISQSGLEKRLKSGTILYEEAKELMNNNKQVIIMGDFNDNPYDESLFRKLNATRCYESVRRHPTELLYNPFWRNIVSNIQYNYTKADQVSFPSGSHRYRDPFGEIWHSYDQILFSGNFLGFSAWHLNEPQTKVIEDTNFLDMLLCSKTIFDHLPVMCEITRP